MPALPLIGQLLLGLGLLGGGARHLVSAVASGLGEPIDPESPGGVTGEGGFGATASGSLFALLSVPEGSAVGARCSWLVPGDLQASGTSGVRSPVFFRVRPAPHRMNSAAWVRLVPRASTAVLPRRPVRPLFGPGRLTEIGGAVAAPAPRADPGAGDAVQ